MTALTWPTAPPTAPGLYWARRTPSHDPSVVRVIECVGELWCLTLGSECESRLSDFAEWAGPLAAPEAPKPQPDWPTVFRELWGSCPKGGMMSTERAATTSAKADRPWNWCHKCSQPVDVDDESMDGSQHRCWGCDRMLTIVWYGDDHWEMYSDRQMRSMRERGRS